MDFADIIDGDVASAPADWKTLKPGYKARCKWSWRQVHEWAVDLVDAMPPKVREHVKAGKFNGDKIMKLANLIAEPQHHELKSNKWALQATIKKMPGSIPSHYFLADVWAEANRILKHGLLKGGVVSARALHEGCALRKLWSYLRQLYREATTSWDPDIQELKSLLTHTRSPKKRMEADGEFLGTPDFSALESSPEKIAEGEVGEGEVGEEEAIDEEAVGDETAVEETIDDEDGDQAISFEELDFNNLECTDDAVRDTLRILGLDQDADAVEDAYLRWARSTDPNVALPAPTKLDFLDELRKDLAATLPQPPNPVSQNKLVRLNRPKGKTTKKKVSIIS